MRKYKNLYQHEGKWYTKENRKAKVGELVLIVHRVDMNNYCRPDDSYGGVNYKVGDIIKVSVLSETEDVIKMPFWITGTEYLVLVPCATAVTLTENDTYFDEFTQMEQPKYEVLYGGIGSKKQPVPFSKEYYGRGNGKSMKTAKNTADSISIDVNAPEKMTQEEYDKIESNLWRTVNELDARTSGLYCSIYVNYAERIIAELKKRIVHEKRKWTEAEITEAKRYVADKMYSLTKERKLICFYLDTAKPTETIAVLYKRTTPTWPMVQHNDFEIIAEDIKKAIAKCCPTDEQNDDIGKMVATKKLFNEQLPAWMGNKK